MTRPVSDQSITDEMVERAAYPIFVGVARAPWTSREDDEPCPVKPFTKNHARNIARAALSAALDHNHGPEDERLPL